MTESSLANLAVPGLAVQVPQQHIEENLFIGCGDGRLWTAHLKLVELLGSGKSFYMTAPGGAWKFVDDNDNQNRNSAYDRSALYYKVRPYRRVFLCCHTDCAACLVSGESYRSHEEEVSRKFGYGTEAGKRLKTHLKSKYPQANIEVIEIYPLVFDIKAGQWLSPEPLPNFA